MNQFISKKEDLLLDKDFPFDFYNACKNKNDTEFLHYHDCLEINYVIKGSGVNFIDNSSYFMKAGDLFIINNLSHHMTILNNSLDMKIITFNPELIFYNDTRDLDYLKSFYLKTSKSNNLIVINEKYSEVVFNLFEQIEDEWKMKSKGYKLFIRAQLMQLLAVIFRSSNSTLEAGSLSRKQMDYERIRNSIEYLNNNINVNISLTYLASLSNMSKNYFCSYFKKVMGVNTLHYVDIIRINKACLFLKTTTKSILNISFDCGYNNIASFNAAFKKICNVTPSVYRKNLNS
ncbi:MAG: AraC family transcriptional regulator [Spirochaetia bacterium]|nr:AraC family transcriptional regulator [Spirochaetia bacterium]